VHVGDAQHLTSDCERRARVDRTACVESPWLQRRLLNDSSVLPAVCRVSEWG
jgi:hypothetical protein